LTLRAQRWRVPPKIVCIVVLPVRFFPVPERLRPYIERAVAIDFSAAVGFRWQFFPTGCYGLNLLVGPQAHDFELERAHDDGLLAGIAQHGMGTWCERPCHALGLSLTPLAAVHLPLAAHDFDTWLGAPNEVMLGRAALHALRARMRDAASVEDKVHTLLRGVESLLFERRPAHGRALAVAEVAHRMREPHPPSVDEAAARVGVHRRQLERDFRRWLAVAPKRYATVARVQQVGQLAWQGHGLAQIAAELGYFDQAHMANAVKDVTGMAPGVLLQRARDSALAQAMRPGAGGRITHL
jgi:AraC-like DNA-binding protein